jgi:hypothetical protein
MYWKTVTKEEFDCFIRTYNKELETHLTTICFPEVLGHYDHSLQDALVASVLCSESLPEYDYKNVYRLRNSL